MSGYFLQPYLHSTANTKSPLCCRILKQLLCFLLHYHSFFLKKAKICHFSFTGLRFYWHEKCNSSLVTEYFEFHSKLWSIMGWSFYTSEVCAQLFSPELHFLRASGVRGTWTSLGYAEQCPNPTTLTTQLQGLRDWCYQEAAPVKRFSIKERGLQKFAKKKGVEVSQEWKVWLGSAQACGTEGLICGPFHLL